MSNVRNQSRKIGFDNRTAQAIKNAATGNYGQTEDDSEESLSDDDYLFQKDYNNAFPLLRNSRGIHIATNYYR